MAEGRLYRAPIWDDIKTFQPKMFPSTDIILSGFPCQDISIAGNGKGLEGERSGLFFEITRLANEIRPSYIFLENVPAITSRGGIRCVTEIASLGYDCRWLVISAASLGAPHKRERWFLLAYAKSRTYGQHNDWTPERQESESGKSACGEDLSSDTESIGMPSGRCEIGKQERQSLSLVSHTKSYWEETECPLCGVDDVVPQRLDRIKSLGNSVVPAQAKEAFKILMGLK